MYVSNENVVYDLYRIHILQCTSILYNIIVYSIYIYICIIYYLFFKKNINNIVFSLITLKLLLIYNIML